MDRRVLRGGAHGNGPLPAVVLVVDDDAVYRAALAEFIRDDGFDVREYANPLDIPDLSAFGTDLVLVVTDYRMPGEHGLAFADRCHALRPEVPIVLVTSDGATEVLTEAARRPFLRICAKPVADADLTALLRLAHGAEQRAR